MPSLKLTVATAAALLASTALASANVISGSYNETHSYSHTPTWGTSGVNNTGFSPTHTIGFSGFNGTHSGHLTSVSIKVLGNAKGTISVTNTGSSGTFTFTAYNTLKAKVPNGPTVSVTPHGSAGTSLSNGQKATLGITATTKKTSITSGSITSLAAYSTAWNALAGDYGSVGFSAGFKGHAQFGGTGTVKVEATYNYQYTTTPTAPVPEPASFAILGTGLVGLGVLRRRRR